VKWGIDRSPILTRMSELPGCGNFIHQQYDRYLRMKFEIDWRYIRNPASHRSLVKSPPRLNAIQRRIVDELMARGVSLCHFDELLEDPGLWRRLSEQLCSWSSSSDVQSFIRKSQKEFADTQDLNAVPHYIITYYPQDQKPLIAPGNPLLEMGLNSRILDVVNTYLGMWSKLIYFDMWHTMPLNTDTRILSQRWHRDPEDRRKIRTFLYFNTVDEDSGAMEYFVGSQSGGPYENVFPWKDPLQTPYPPDGEVENQMPPKEHIFLAGPPGTLVFCDTAGFHRGGTAKLRPRILATAAYVTPASLHHQRYRITHELSHSKLNPEARFALT
jgi:hypothetical protein